MKKFLALVMAMLMVLAMGTVAFADTTIPDTSNGKATFTKYFNGVNTNSDEAKSPAQTFTFTIAPCTDHPAVDNAGNALKDASGNAVTTPDLWNGTTISSEEFAIGAVTGKGTSSKAVPVTIDASKFPTYGIYYYVVTEQNPAVAGISYKDADGNANTMYMVVTIIVDGTTGKKAVGGIHYTHDVETKTNKTTGITNTYSANNLTVSKIISGNMADATKEFEMTVKFEAPANETVKSTITYKTKVGDTDFTELTWSEGKATATIYLKGGDSVTFYNIPKGVTYTVTETEANQNGYTTTYDNATNTINGTNQTATVTNVRGEDVDTGLFMDNAPYMMIMAMVVLAGVAMMMKRRAYND